MVILLNTYGPISQSLIHFPRSYLISIPLCIINIIQTDLEKTMTLIYIIHMALPTDNNLDHDIDDEDIPVMRRPSRMNYLQQTTIMEEDEGSMALYKAVSYYVVSTNLVNFTIYMLFVCVMTTKLHNLYS